MTTSILHHSLRIVAYNRIFDYIMKEMRFLFQYLALLFPFVSAGQGERMVHSRFSPQEVINFSWQQYGAQRQNWSISQDSKTGFVYVGNSQGLLEYDGAIWRLWQLPQKQIIRSVHVGRDGRIYTGALGEFGYWQPGQNGQLQYTSLKSLVPDRAFATEEVWHIVEFKGEIYFQSFAFLYRYNGKRVQALPPPATILFGFVVADQLYFEAIGQGLFYVTPQGKWKKIPDSDFLGKETIQAILPGDRFGEIWIGTQRKIYRYDGKRFEPHPNKTLQRFIQENQLNTARKLRNGDYFWGSLLGGGLRTDRFGNALEKISKASGLQNNTIISTFEDRENLLWLGLDNGISMVLQHASLRLFEDRTDEIGTVYDATLFQGTLYVASNHGVFYRKGNQFYLVPGSQGQAWDLFQEGNTLFCGHNTGTFALSQNRWSALSPITGGWHLIPVKPDLLLQGTYTQLCIYKKEKGEWKFSHTLAGFSGPVKELVQVNNQQFLALTAHDGLHELTIDTDFKKVIGNKVIQGLPFVTSIERTEKTIWLGTEKGSFVYQNGKIASQAFAPFQRVQVGPRNSIWGISTRGELFLQPSKAAWQRIPLARKYQLGGAQKVVTLADSLYFVGHESGFSLLELNQTSGVNTLHQPFLRSVQQGKKRWLFRPEDDPTLPDFGYKENTFHFQAGVTTHAREVQYAFWMENEDTSWGSWQTSPSRMYANLKPGEYRLHVRTSDGAQSKPITFQISDPWFWHPISQILYALALISLLFTLYQWHLRRLDRLQKQKEEELRVQEEKNQQELMALRTAQLEQDVIRKSEELANSTLRLIKNTESLQTLKERLNQLPPSKSVQQILDYLDKHFASTDDWKVFEQNFNQVHEQFLKKLIEDFPTLSPGDLKLAGYLRMNLSTKEIAQLLNITPRSAELKRYRLRQKLGIGTEENLVEFLMRI